MAPDIDTQTTEPDSLRLGWSRGLSLTSRILAVNLFVIALLAGGLFFLDSYRSRLIEQEREAIGIEAQAVADTLPLLEEADRDVFLKKYAMNHKSRIRLYGKDGRKILDTFQLDLPTYEIKDPDKEPWRKKAAKFADQTFDFLVLADRLPKFTEPRVDNVDAWQELNPATPDTVKSIVRIAADATHVASAGITSSKADITILNTTNARSIRLFVRAERSKILLFFLLVFTIGILLSLFLARTIVKPIKHLARAAVKVRLGRAQEVTVPRIPSRRDEIGLLARSLSDMSIALRQRIDATEAFAADVAHEIKNPLASMRSALDGLDNVKQADLREQLIGVAKADVKRMDRLISDISEASRVDAQLARAKFEPIDLGDMIEQLLAARESRDSEGNNRIAFARPRKGVAVVMGEDLRLERVLNNLIDNAVSFSPDGGLIELSATCANDEVWIRVTDEGPGVAPSEREAIFRRFHSERPEGEDFGNHSGLGLAIARTIVEGHQGHINIVDREDGKSGACFEIALPSAEAALG